MPSCSGTPPGVVKSGPPESPMQMLGDVTPAQIGKSSPQEPGGWIVRVASLELRGIVGCRLVDGAPPDRGRASARGRRRRAGDRRSARRRGEEDDGDVVGERVGVDEAGVRDHGADGEVLPAGGGEVGLAGHHDQPVGTIDDAVRCREDRVRRDHGAAAGLPVDVVQARNDEGRHERVGPLDRGRSPHDAGSLGGMSERHERERQRGDEGGQSQAHDGSRQDTTGCRRIASPGYALGCVISIGTTQRS